MATGDSMEIGDVSAEVGERLDYEVPMTDFKGERRADLTKIVWTVLDVLKQHGFIEIEEVDDGGG